MCPSEIVVLAVKDLFCRAPLVVVQYDFLVGHVPVVGQYAAVCILAVEEVKLLALLPALPLYDETAVLHVLETLEGEGLYVIALETNLHGGPTRLPLHFLVQACISLGTDVELFRMLHDHFHDVLAIGAAVGTETPDMNAKRPHHLEETAVSLCLLEAHVTVAVAILQIGNQPADGEHAGAVAVKALVGPLAVILVRLKELVVEINVVCSALRKLSRCQQQLDEQLVEFLRRVEVIDVAGLFRCIRYVLRCQFLYATQHSVRAWDAGMRTLGKNVLQIQVEVFHTVTTAAEHGEDGTYDLAVLIANQSAAKS